MDGETEWSGKEVREAGRGVKEEEEKVEGERDGGRDGLKLCDKEIIKKRL